MSGVSQGTRWCLIGGLVLLISAFGGGSWPAGLMGAALIGGAALVIYSSDRNARPLEPWPWPSDFRAQAEALARPIDPTPRRILPPDEKAAMVAHVATTPAGLARLTADKPPNWRYAAFASVLLQRRNGVQARLRQCVSGYQPRPGQVPLDGRAYSLLAGRIMSDVADQVRQVKQFMLSPAFAAAVAFPGEAGQTEVDPDTVVSIANRLMDYHETFLAHAETAVQTAVQPEVRMLLGDVGAFTLCPLMGYDGLIETLCERVGEAQDLLPYTHGGTVIDLGNADLEMTLPDGLTDRIVSQIKRFSQT